MVPTPPQYVNGLAQILPIEEETPYSTPIFRPAAVRRTPSFSSSSRSNSWDSSSESPPFSLIEDYSPPPYSPSTPLNLIGIPFSWEQTPGIPKDHQANNFKKKESSGRHLLPLPPAGTAASATKKHQTSSRFKRDPFFAALVECSKDDDDDDDDDDYDHGTSILKGGFKITRSISDRFGFMNMYTSCKRTCAVSESIVYLPRASPHYLPRRRPRRSS